MRTLCLVLLVLGAGLVGCSRQDFTRGPVANPLTNVLDSRRPYMKPGKTPDQLRSERLAKVLAAQRGLPKGTAADYLVGPNDILEVGIFALEEPGKTTFIDRTVSETGHVTLPWIGKVSASAVTTRELEERITAAYAGKYIVNPQVTVTVKEYQSVAVTVTGSVNKPDVYYLKRNTSSVLEMLAMAGGITPEAGDLLLVIRQRNGNGARPAATEETPAVTPTAPATGEGADPPAESSEATAAEAAPDDPVTTIDLKQLIDEGSLLLNLPVGNGDVITVPPRPKAYVYILGYVQHPGAYELKDGMLVDALRAVALGGGLASSARASNSVLIRDTPQGQRAVRVDLIKIARGIRPPLYLEPGDTLVIGSSFDARLAEYIRPRANVGASTAF
jgi:polysaccharide export outer membrane protein